MLALPALGPLPAERRFATSDDESDVRRAPAGIRRLNGLVSANGRQHAGGHWPGASWFRSVVQTPVCGGVEIGRLDHQHRVLGCVDRRWSFSRRRRCLTGGGVGVVVGGGVGVVVPGLVGFGRRRDLDAARRARFDLTRRLCLPRRVTLTAGSRAGRRDGLRFSDTFFVPLGPRTRAERIFRGETCFNLNVATPFFTLTAVKEWTLAPATAGGRQKCRQGDEEHRDAGQTGQARRRRSS